MDGYIGKAKAYLDARRGERVTLGELASAVGASPFHLQRRFKEAFGVSPRDYQDAHRVESVKASLQNGRRVADAVFEAGYGSVSRFYEKPMLGMKARDYRARGKASASPTALSLRPSAPCSSRRPTRAFARSSWAMTTSASNASSLEEFRAAEIVPGELKDLKARILAFIEGETSLARLPLDIRGTVFQRRVWDELRRIPRGETRTYAQIARAIGAPAAVRAVGSACGANPVALAVPCHRAVRTDGGMGGYAWGLQRKRKLLALEKKR